MFADNWQEAAIILCLALIGLVYVLSARGMEQEEKPSLAQKHLVG